MISRILRWIRDRPVRSAALALVLAVLALNVLAFFHAYSMTHFVEDGGRIASPESMTPLQRAGVLVFGVRTAKPKSLVTPEHVGLSFEVHRFESPDGLEYEAWFVPNSKSDLLVILFHGYGELKSHLLDEAKAFHELGMNVLLVDFRGAGGSSGFETTIGFREADDVVAAMAYAQDRFTRELPILYGRSMGSAAVLRAISFSETKVRGVVLESPFDRLLSTVKNRFSAMGIPSFPCSELLVFWGGACSKDIPGLHTTQPNTQPVSTAPP